MVGAWRSTWAYTTLGIGAGSARVDGVDRVNPWGQQVL
jgi:hypothetical protein